jgi:hypothetical protein
MDYLSLACRHLDVEPDKVLAYKQYEDHLAIVVDNGIAGCPKYLIPLAELVPEPEPEKPKITTRRRNK